MLNFNKKKYVSFDNLKSFNGLLQSSLKEKIDGYKSEVDTKVQKKFNELSGKVQTDSEVIDARKGEASLRAKIDVIDEDIKNVGSQLAHNQKIKGYKTPEEFGAIGDGVNDDSIAFKEAIINCANNNYTLMLKGRYRIATNIQIDSGNSVTIIGNKGNYKSLTSDMQSINNEPFDLFLDNDAIIEIDRFGSITFQNVGFSSNSKESKSSIILKSFHNKFVNCSFSQFGKAISILKGGKNWLGENQILSCGFFKCGYGIYADSGSDSEVLNCLFHGTCDYGFWGNCAGYTFSNNHFNPQLGNKFIAFNTKITNNYIQETNNDNPSITIEPRFGVLIANNNFELVSTEKKDNVKGLIGIEMLNGRGNITIIGNSVHGKDLNVVENLSFIYLIGETSYNMPLTIGVNNIKCCDALFNIEYPLYNITGTVTLTNNEPTKLGGEFNEVISKVVNGICTFYVDMTPPAYENFIKVKNRQSDTPYTITIEETLTNGTIKTYNRIVNSSTISFSNYSEIQNVKILGSYVVSHGREMDYCIK